MTRARSATACAWHPAAIVPRAEVVTRPTQIIFSAWSMRTITSVSMPRDSRAGVRQNEVPSPITVHNLRAGELLQNVWSAVCHARTSHRKYCRLQDRAPGTLTFDLFVQLIPPG